MFNPVFLFLACNCVGVVAAALRELAPAGNGSAVFVSWSQPGTEHWPASGGEQLMHYVMEWRSGSAGLHWQRVGRDQNSTFITGAVHTYTHTCVKYVTQLSLPTCLGIFLFLYVLILFIMYVCVNVYITTVKMEQ